MTSSYPSPLLWVKYTATKNNLFKSNVKKIIIAKSNKISELTKLEYRVIIKYLYVKGLGAKQIYKNVLNTLGEKYPTIATIKN